MEVDYFTRSTLTKASRTKYNRTLQRWVDVFGKETPVEPPYIYANPHESVKKLRDWLMTIGSDTPNVLNNHITALMAYRKYNPQLCHPDARTYAVWKRILELSYTAISDHLKKNEPSRTQQLKDGIDMTMEEIVAIRDSLPLGISKLLLAFYTMIPPVRADYGMVQILYSHRERPSTANYIIIEDGQAFMRLTDFKTSSTYREIAYPLPQPLYELLLLSLQDNPRNYLFQNTLSGPYTRQAFSSWANQTLSSLFGKAFTLTMFRHIFLSSLSTSITVEEREDIAKKMGHSLTLQMCYVWKD